jgi:hypothetical protein
MRHFLLLTALLLLTDVAAAAVEKIAEPSESGLRLIWWPKVNPPDGWHFDEGSSHQLAFKALAPNGSTFSNAETVIYAKANFKPRTPETKSLESLIEQDIASFKKSESGVTVVREKPLLSGDGKPFQVVAFSPNAGGNWERVAYAEEGEYYVIFTVSSRTKEGLAQATPAFQSTIVGYRAGP